MSLIKFDDIENICNELRRDRNINIITTNGCFDLLHIGHVKFLEMAKGANCFFRRNILIVGVNSDKSVRRLKGPGRPINNQSDRAKVLLGLQSVDYVVIFDQDDPRELLKKIRPSLHCKGGDYFVDEMPETEIVQEFGGGVYIIPLVKGSTTEIIEKIKEKDSEYTNKKY